MQEKERQQFPEIFDKFNKLDTRYTFKNLYFFWLTCVKNFVKDMQYVRIRLAVKCVYLSFNCWITIFYPHVLKQLLTLQTKYFWYYSIAKQFWWTCIIVSYWNNNESILFCIDWRGAWGFATKTGFQNHCSFLKTFF